MSRQQVLCREALEVKRPRLPSAYAETYEVLVRLKPANRVGLVEEIAARCSQEQAALTSGQIHRHAAIWSDRIGTRPRDTARCDNAMVDASHLQIKDSAACAVK